MCVGHAVERTYYSGNKFGALGRFSGPEDGEKGSISGENQMGTGEKAGADARAVVLGNPITDSP